MGFWKPKKANRIVPVKVCGAESQESCWYKFVFEGKKKPNVPAHQLGRKSSSYMASCSFQASVDWMKREDGWMTRGRAIGFTQPMDSNVNLLQKHPHGHTPNKVHPNDWAPGSPVSLTRKMNYVTG